MQTEAHQLEISDDDVPLIHRSLSEEAYWRLGISLCTVQPDGKTRPRHLSAPLSPAGTR